MKRAIIEINEELCDGCGDCVISCAEGAIEIIDGKAKVMKEEFCDGLGACLGTCHADALKIIEREAPEFDEIAAMEHVRNLEQVNISDETLAPSPPAHQQFASCPGSRVQVMEEKKDISRVLTRGLPSSINPSDLTQWPIQLHLLPTKASFFDDKELCFMATCAPLASADVHWRFLRGRSVAVACPKLDKTETYIDKLAAIFSSNRIPKIVVVRMSVPCCGGLGYMVKKALEMIPNHKIQYEEVVVGIDGEVIS
jgi:NAD-dependent dihydropyrimidine dehydrogenase PreA subunit